jgi:solute carrier family 13 (sodium-dependent dicarboxylate transporter), member 2/3/5
MIPEALGRERPTTAVVRSAQAIRQKVAALLPTPAVFGAALGPLVGLVIWGLPLGLDPVAQRAVAIVGLMLVYWMTEVLDYGVTALLGCVLFWLLHVAPPAVVFGGFSTPIPWFIFGSLVLAQAVSQTGLAKRLGYYVTYAAKGSPTRVLLAFTVLVFVFGLFMTQSAQIATLAPVAMGVFTTLGLPVDSNTAKGVFLTLGYVGTLFDKMKLSSALAILTWGMVEKQTGVTILWSQWFLAFLPLIIPTILASWLTMRWLYPPEPPSQPLEHTSWPATVHTLGPWSWGERKVLGWLLLAITLWSTDFWHQINPAAIAIAIAVILTLPGLGVLDMKAVKSVNLLTIVFVGGVLSMAEVLSATHALTPLINLLDTWQEALLSNAWSATLSLYWGGFLYHFLMGSEYTMVSTVLPVLLKVAILEGYNPAAIALLWNFTAGGKLFVYQSTAIVLAYSYGFFQPKDLLKVGAVLTVVEGLFILLLVPFYWSLIGLPWRHDSSAPTSAPGVSVQHQPGAHQPGVVDAHLAVTWAQLEPHRGQFDWRVIDMHPIVVKARLTGQPFGLQIRLQGTPSAPGIPAWTEVPVIQPSPRQNAGHVWPAMWSNAFQRAFPPFVRALAERFDGDQHLAYLVMSDATAIPYAQNPARWDQAGFTIAGYKQAYQHVYQTYRQAFRKTSLAVAIDGFAYTNAQALRELLEFAGDKGFLFFFADGMSQARLETSYLKDEILLPVVRNFAPRSQVLVMLRPDARMLRKGGNHVVQVAQERWPELPIHAVVLDHTKSFTPARQARPPQDRPARRVLVLGDTPG